MHARVNAGKDGLTYMTEGLSRSDFVLHGKTAAKQEHDCLAMQHRLATGGSLETAWQAEPAAAFHPFNADGKPRDGNGGQSSLACSFAPPIE